MRLIAVAADMMKPYIKINSVDNSTINYTLHGCGHIEKINFYMIPESEFGKPLNDKYIFANKTEQFCYWGRFFANHSYWDTMTFKPKDNHIIYIQLVGVDNAFSSQSKPKPEIKPQGHLVRLRSITNYTVSNDNYILKGDDRFISNPIININGNYVEIDDYNAYIFNSSMLSLIDNNSTKNIQTYINVTRTECSCKSNDWHFDVSVKYIYNPNNTNLDNITLNKKDTTEFNLYNKNLNCDEVNSFNGNCDVFTRIYY
jgi:hypothetical protein